MVLDLQRIWTGYVNFTLFSCKGCIAVLADIYIGIIHVSIVTDLHKAFLDNGSVNTFHRTTMEDVSQWTNVVARC
jgi:hypothetical protein